MKWEVWDIRKKGIYTDQPFELMKKTPITFSELTLNQIIKAKQEKAKTGSVKRFV